MSFKDWYNEANNNWKKEKEARKAQEKRAFYECTYFPACEVVLPVVNQNSRNLGIHPVKDAVALMAPSGVISDGRAWFYTMEFPKLDTDTDPHGLGFRNKMNTQLGNYVKHYGGQLPLIYLELARNLRVVMIRSTGSSFIAYFGMMNDPWMAEYVNRRYCRR
ncbi:MAG: hypothetical protein LUK37_03640 [Clostridia bacterium]|nr:hypothetical protein [Clostridia bacterium]